MSEDSKIEDNVEEDVVSDDVLLEELKVKAHLLGVKYHPKVGVKKLKEKLDLHLSEFREDVEPTESEDGIVSKGPSKTIATMEKDARRTKLVIITDNDATDVDNPTIVSGVQNAYFKVGPVIIKKDEEQLVPACIIASLKPKTMIKWVPSINTMTRRPTGNKIAETRKRYNITYI